MIIMMLFTIIVIVSGALMVLFIDNKPEFVIFIVLFNILLIYLYSVGIIDV